MRESLDRSVKNFPPATVSILLAEGALGECLLMQHKYAAAEPLIVHSYETLAATQGEKNSYTINSRKRAVELYEKWAQPDRAAKYRAVN